MVKGLKKAKTSGIRPREVKARDREVFSYIDSVSLGDCSRHPFSPRTKWAIQMPSQSHWMV